MIFRYNRYLYTLCGISVALFVGCFFAYSASFEVVSVLLLVLFIFSLFLVFFFLPLLDMRFIRVISLDGYGLERIEHFLKQRPFGYISCYFFKRFERLAAEKQLFQWLSSHKKSLENNPFLEGVHNDISACYTHLAYLYPPESSIAKFYLEEAVEELKISLDVDPFQVDVWKRLCFLYELLQKKEEMLKDLEKAGKERALPKELLFILGVLYFEKGRVFEGFKVYQDLLEKDPSLAGTLFKKYAER